MEQQDLRGLEALLRGLRLEVKDDQVSRVAFREALKAVVDEWSRESSVKITDRALIQDITAWGVVNADLYVLEDGEREYSVIVKHGYDSSAKAYKIFDVKIVS